MSSGNARHLQRSVHPGRTSTLRFVVFAAILLLTCLASEAFAQRQAEGFQEEEILRTRDRLAEEQSGDEGETLELVAPMPEIDLALDLPAGDNWSVAQFELACDLPRCEESSYLAQLEAIAGIESATVTNREQLVRAVERLARLEIFDQITGRVEILRGDVVRVAFEASGATLIRNVRIRGGSFPGDAIKRRISLRSGGYWTGSEDQLERNREAIRNYFERQGLYGTTVEIEPELIDDFTVDINIRVRSGRRLTIDRIYVRGNEVLSYDEISSTILDQFNFLQSFTRREVQRALNAVLRRYREEGYIQARFTVAEPRINEENQSADLYLEIREGEEWEIRFTGNETFSDDALRDALTFYETGFIDDIEIENAVTEIRSLYETRGYYFVEIDVTRRREANGAQLIWFRIRENNVAEIRNIRLSGVSAFPEDAILDLLQTSEYDLITPGGFLQRARLNDELKRIEDFYRDAGYLSARVPRVTMTGRNSGRALDVTIFVEEGPRTVLANVAILENGQPVELRGSEAAELVLDEGEPFNLESLEEDRETVREIWSRRGFGNASVETHCYLEDGVEVECIPEAAPQECALSLSDQQAASCQRYRRGDVIVEECLLVEANPECVQSGPLVGASVTIEQHIEPGPQVQLARVFLQGNFATDARAILQELPLDRSCYEGQSRRDLRSGWEPSGDCRYIPEQFNTGQANLRSLGIFDSVRIEVIGPDEDLDEVTVVLKLEEAINRFVDYRVGVDLSVATGERSLLALPNELIYRDLNFLGRAQELRISGRFEPPILDAGRIRDAEFNADLRFVYFDPRSYIFGRFRRPWETRAELAASWNMLQLPPAPLTRTVSLDLRARNRIRRYRGLFVELGFNVRRSAARDQLEGIEDAPFETVNVISITPRITIERRDNPLNPTRGYFGDISMEFADNLFGLLGADAFTRFETRHSGYIPLGRDVVLAMNARFGVGFGPLQNLFRSDRTLSLPLAERFFLGGVTTLRGYARNAVPAVGTDEAGGDVLVGANIELRYPLIPSLDIYGTAFVDAGQLAANVSDLRFDETRLSTGVGVRWLIAGILPLLLDYGTVLNRRPGEGFGRLHFNIGYTF